MSELVDPAILASPASFPALQGAGCTFLLGRVALDGDQFAILVGEL